MRQTAEQIAEFGGKSVKSLGLRFDRVALRLLSDLETAAEGLVPEGMTVIVTVTAPIWLPAKTIAALETALGEVFDAKTAKLPLARKLHGNQVKIRSVMKTPAEAPRVIGFVHNPTIDPTELFALTEKWLRAY